MKMTPAQALQNLYNLAITSKNSVAADLPGINELHKIVDEVVNPKPKAEKPDLKEVKKEEK